MSNSNDASEKTKKKDNAALNSFKHEREKGFIRNRVLAALIDFIVIGFLIQLAFIAFGTPDWEAYFKAHDEMQNLPKEDIRVVERFRLYNECLVVSLVIGASYETLFCVLFNTTPGKHLFGLKLVYQKENRNYLVNRLFCLIRAVAKALSIFLLSAIPFILLCLTVYGNEEARSGFDMIAGTKVVSRSAGITALFKRKS